MRILVNGRPEEVADAETVAELLVQLQIERRGAAVAVDGDVLPKGEWDTTKLREGQRIEVLRAVQGG